MKNFSPLSSQKGIALLIVLSVITVLVSLSLVLYQKMNAAFDESTALRYRETLAGMTSSGIQVGMAMLVKDKEKTKIDSLQEDWADPEAIQKALTGITFDEGTLSVVISDEKSRIQVNALVAPPGHEFNQAQLQLWIRLMQFIKNHFKPLSDMDHMEFIDSLKDWIDSGDDDAVTGLSGAESAYYRDLDPPYDCRNAPLNHLGDLPRIKGFPKEMLSPEATLPKLSDLLTVEGLAPSETGAVGYDGKININTADVLVLTALLPEEYQVLAQEMADFRTEKADETFIHDLSSPKWYTGIPGMEDLALDPGFVTVSSDLFRITATATLREVTLVTEAVVLREKAKASGKWRCKILYRRTV